MDKKAAIELGNNLSKPKSKFLLEKDADQPCPAKKQKKKVPVDNIGHKSLALVQLTKSTAKGQVVEVLLPLRMETVPTKKAEELFKLSMLEILAHQQKVKARPKLCISAAPLSKKDMSWPVDQNYNGDSEKAAKEPEKDKKCIQIKSKETVESDNDAGHQTH
ncbi:hypothetical protein BDN70DRAFT_899856 [Pholiota conissans]|uniref:Uncharacterized protein n=1 Tax=Pholiota conissans TaxID=109636 RepID=A0A9P5YRD3_9AGAR|nr:hypothetical protein BDN70DRAFT_899856 [Pholiota conissans]